MNLSLLKKRNLPNIYLIIFLLISVNLYSQNVVITYPLAAEDIESCYSYSELTVRIDFLENSTSNSEVIIDLPDGVSYVAGSVLKIGGTATININDNGGSLNTPHFTIESVNTTIGDYIIFTISRRADCLAKNNAENGFIFKDTVTTIYNGNSIVENNININSYFVRFASLSFQPPLAQNDVVINQNYTRTFSITNGSSYCIDELYLTINNSNNGVTLNTLSINGSLILPTAIVGSTSYYTINGASLTTDGILCYGENLTFTEIYYAYNCSPSPTIYQVGWGCNSVPSNWCQTVGGIGEITMATGVPTLGSFTGQMLNYVDSCSPFTTRVTYTNTGTGNTVAATMFNTKYRLGGGSSASMSSYSFSLINFTNARINGLTVPLSGGMIDGIATINVVDFFTTDPDGIGGLTDSDGDGYFDDLPPGQTIVFDINTQINCSRFSCLNGNLISTWPAFKSDIEYTSMCSSSSLNTTILSSSPHYVLFGLFGNKSYAPSNISNNTPFTARFSTGYYALYFGPFDTINTRYVYEITLPFGYSVSGSGNVQWHYGQYPEISVTIPTTFTQIGNVITVTSPNQNMGWFTIDLVADCSLATTGTTQIPFKLIRIDNVVTSCVCNSYLYCDFLTINNLICPAGCGSGGVFITNAKVERSDNSLGWTDTTLSTHQLRSGISDYDLSKALYLDEIEITANGIQSATIGTDLFVKLNIAKLGGSDTKLTPLVIDVKIKRGGLVLQSGTSGVFSMAASTANNQYVDWNISAFVPFGGLLPDDVIETKSYYRVATQNLPNHDIQTGVGLYLYNKNGTTTEFHCNSLVPEMYLVSPVFTDAHNGGGYLQANSCNSLSVGGGGSNDYAYRFDTLGTVFLNEIRPGFLPTAYEFTIPANYELVGVYNSNYGSAILTPTTIVGNTYRYVLPERVYPITVTNTYSTIFNVVVKPTCGSVSGGELLNSKLEYIPFYYHNREVATPPTFIATKSLSVSYNNDSRPSLSLTNLTGSIQAATSNQEFKVRLTSTGSSTAAYTWLSIPNTPGITITGVRDLITNVLQPATSYPGGNIYQLSAAGLTSSSYKDYKIELIYTGCTSIDFTIYAGWNCTNFPLDPITYTCSKEELELSILNTPTEIQLVNTIAPTNVVNLCDPILYQYEFQNVQSGNIYNPTIQIGTPTGMSLQTGSIQVEYPINSGNWEVLPYFLSGQTYTIDLSLHSQYPLLGIPGTLLSLDSNARVIRIQFYAITDCSFVSGSRFTISMSSFAFCGSTVSGSNVDFLSVANVINGANVNYATINDINIVAGSIANCGESITYECKSNIILSGPTGTTGSLYFEYPNGFDYIPGSFTCTSGNCTVFDSVVTLTNGNKAVKCNIPIGLGNGQLTTFTVQLLKNSDAICGNTDFVLTGQDTTTNLPCGASLCTIVSLQTGSVIKTYTFTCFQNAILGTPKLPGVLISSLNRTDLTSFDFEKANGYLVLESRNKGFVITRMSNPETQILNPVEGMLVYDTDDHCLKLYNGTVWDCITQRCN